jgi:cation transport ATPase
VDGRIEQGSLSVDQQHLTGESVPRALGPGETVYAGTLVLRGQARARVTVAGRETTLARVQRTLRVGAGHQTALHLKAAAIADAASVPLLGVSALAWPLIGPSAALAILFSAPVNAVRAVGALAVSGAVTARLADRRLGEARPCPRGPGGAAARGSPSEHSGPKTLLSAGRLSDRASA